MKLFWVFFLGLLVFSCQEGYKIKEVNNSFSLQSFPTGLRLESEKLDLGIVYSPVDVFFNDSLLFISSIGQGYNVSVFQSNKGHRKLGEIFKNGAGPSETYSIAKMDFMPDGSVWVHDVVSTMMKHFDIEFESDSLFAIEKDMVLFMNPILSSAYLNDSLFFTTTQAIHPFGRFYIYSRNSEKLEVIGKYPDFGVEMPPMVAVDVFWGNLVTHPNRQKFALAYQYTDLVEFYDLEGSLMKRIHGPHQFLPDFDIGDRAGTPYMKRVYEKTRHAYKSLAANEDQIFLLYANSRTVKPGEGEASIHYDKVVVLDWEGNPLAFYELDHAVTSIAVDWKRKVMYGLDRIESEVYAFKF
jgi:hypothetical protein